MSSFVVKYSYDMIFAFYLVSLISTLILSQSSTVLGQNFYICIPGTGGNLTSNPVYASNLNTLLTNPNFTNPSTNFGYYNDSVGNKQEAFGLVLCRFDLNGTECQACVASAISSLRSLCPSTKSAVAWWEQCTVRYSDVDFFGQLSNMSFYEGKPGNATQPIFVDIESIALFKYVSAQAVLTSFLYAAGELDLGGSYINAKMYVFVQCTRDISSAQCATCLEGAIAQVQPDQKVGGRVIGGSCEIRYEIYKFLSHF